MLTEPVPPSPALPRRSWKQGIFRGCIQVVFGLGLPLGIAVAFYHYERSTQLNAKKRLLAEAIVETDQLDPRWRWEQLEEDRRQPGEAENSVHVFTKIADTFDTDLRRLDRFRDYQITEYLTRVQPQETLNEEDATRLRGWLAKYTTLRNLARTLADCPVGLQAMPLPDNPLQLRYTHGDTTEAILGLLMADTEEQSLLGDTTGFIISFRAMLHANRLFRDEPSMYRQQVRMMIRRMAVRRVEHYLGLNVPTSTLQPLFASLAEEFDDPLFETGLRGERAILHRLLSNLETRKISVKVLGQHFSELLLADEELTDENYAPKLYFTHAYLLRRYNRFQEISRTPLHLQAEALDRISFPPDDREHDLARLLLSAVHHFHTASLRDQTLVRCCLVAIAVEEYRRLNGHWPATLNDVPLELLKTIPSDPYDGRPIRYRLTADGVVIHSISTGIGDMARPSENTLRDRNSDLKIRLWNPELRRQWPIVLDPKSKLPRLPMPQVDGP